MRQKRRQIEIHFTQGCIAAAALYFFLAALFYYAAGDQLYERRSKNEISIVTGDSAAPEVTREHTVRQEFLCEMDKLKSFQAAVCTFSRVNTGDLQICLYDLSAQKELYTGSWQMEGLEDGQIVECVL